MKDNKHNTKEIIWKKKGDKLENGNQVIVEGILENSEVIFKEGVKNSKLYISEGVKIIDSLIVFKGDDSLIYFDKGDVPGRRNSFWIRVHNNSCFYVGKHSSFVFRKRNYIEVASNTNVFVGNDVMSSYGVELVNTDFHPIFDLKSGKRINYNKSIFVGDKVWIGKGVKISNGAKIGSGTVIGQYSSVFNKKLDSNSIYGGTPAKKLRKNIFWQRKNIMDKNIKKAKVKGEKFEHKYVYENFIDELDKKLIKANTVEKKEEIIKNLDQNKNRFYLGKKENIFDKIKRKLNK